MKVLVTGGAGFIGSHVADRLLADGHDVVILDDLSTGNVEHLQANARFYQMDLRSPWIDELFRIERPEAVLHQAAQASVRRSVDDPVFDAGVNVLGTAALLQASVHHGVRRFLFASTGGALYGDADVTPTPEDYPTLPVSPYGAAKLSAEVYLRTFNALHGLSYAALRYANVYGPRQNPHGEAGVVAIERPRPQLGGRRLLQRGHRHRNRHQHHLRDAEATDRKQPARGARPAPGRGAAPLGGRRAEDREDPGLAGEDDA